MVYETRAILTPQLRGFRVLDRSFASAAVANVVVEVVEIVVIFAHQLAELLPAASTVALTVLGVSLASRYAATLLAHLSFLQPPPRRGRG
jgi:hypothetical protein